MKVWNINDHRGWGNSMRRLSPGKVLTGHMSKGPNKGDIVRAPMEGGKIGEFLIVDIRWMSNVPDQFFACVGFKEYAE